MGRGARILMAAALIAIGETACAKDFGVYGKLFPIGEPDLLAAIIGRLKGWEQDGTLEQMQSDMEAKTRGYLERPPSDSLLLPAEEYRAFQFDPSITVERDLTDHQGQVFARAGTVINPLAFSQFEKQIIVIDGDVPEQVAFAVASGDELNSLIVIARGAPLDLMRLNGRRFWFDQQGVIAKRFSLERLPSVITRQDPFFLIEEIPVTEEGGNE